MIVARNRAGRSYMHCEAGFEKPQHRCKRPQVQKRQWQRQQSHQRRLTFPRSESSAGRPAAWGAGNPSRGGSTGPSRARHDPAGSPCFPKKHVRGNKYDKTKARKTSEGSLFRRTNSTAEVDAHSIIYQASEINTRYRGFVGSGGTVIPRLQWLLDVVAGWSIYLAPSHPHIEHLEEKRETIIRTTAFLELPTNTSSTSAKPTNHA